MLPMQNADSATAKIKNRSLWYCGVIVALVVFLVVAHPAGMYFQGTEYETGKQIPISEPVRYPRPSGSDAKGVVDIMVATWNLCLDFQKWLDEEERTGGRRGQLH